MTKTTLIKRGSRITPAQFRAIKFLLDLEVTFSSGLHNGNYTEWSRQGSKKPLVVVSNVQSILGTSSVCLAMQDIEIRNVTTIETSTCEND